MADYELHRRMQNVAREAMAMTRDALRPGLTLGEVRGLCEEHLLEMGVDGFWYWGVGAFIFAGSDTVTSVSGADYHTPDYVLGNDELVTIDLSPQRNGVWGDYARTLILENGTPLKDARETSNPQWSEGVRAEHRLHAQFRKVAAPSMTFHELAREMNNRITSLGFENLDFRGNLGHSIENDMAHRVFLEAGNHRRLDSVEMVTFEPHIRRPGGTFGYKHENIYHFHNDHLYAL